MIKEGLAARPDLVTYFDAPGVRLGGYRFSDYFRLGFPLSVLVVLAPLVATAAGLQSGVAYDLSEGDSVTLDALSKDVDAAMEDAGTGSMKVTSTNVELAGDFELGKNEAASITGTTGEQPVDVRVVDGVHYLKAPSPEVTQKGKTWIKADPESKNPQDQQLAGSMEAMADLSDPLAAIGGADDVEAKVAKVEDGKVTYEIALSKKQMGKVLEQQAKDAGDEQGAAMAAQQAQKTTTTLVVDEERGIVLSIVRFGIKGGVISAVDIIHGLGVYAGLERSADCLIHLPIRPGQSFQPFDQFALTHDRLLISGRGSRKRSRHLPGARNCYSPPPSRIHRSSLPDRRASCRIELPARIETHPALPDRR